MTTNIPQTMRLSRLYGIKVYDWKPDWFPLERIVEAFDMVAGYKDGVLRAIIQVGNRL